PGVGRREPHPHLGRGRAVVRLSARDRPRDVDQGAGVGRPDAVGRVGGGRDRGFLPRASVSARRGGAVHGSEASRVRGARSCGRARSLARTSERPPSIGDHRLMLTLSAPRRVAIVGANRIPFARSNTAYAEASNQDMLTAALQGLIDRFDLHGLRLGEVAAGAVLKLSRDIALTRESVLGTTLGRGTPAYDVQQACGTGLEAAILVANKIALGQIEVGIAGGVDTTSDAPIALNEGFRRALLAANRQKSMLGRLKALSRAGLTAPFRPEPPRNAEPRTGLSMGEHCELMAKHWAIPREEQDALAIRSHRNMAAAYETGLFDEMITPFNGLKRDNNLRPDIDPAKVAAMRPVFDRENGTLTAANSTPLTDGASTVLLASEEWAKARGLPILAWMRAGETAAVDFVS